MLTNITVVTQMGMWTSSLSNQPYLGRLAAAIALTFGLATISASATVLLGPDVVKQGAGATVDFVLWFNLAAGFVYIAGAEALYHRRPWAFRLAVAIAGATALVGLAFTLHAVLGGAFTWRTPGALLFRIAVWSAIAYMVRPGRRAEGR